MTDEAFVIQLVADVLGEQPIRVTHMPFGHNSITYQVSLPDRHLIVRTHQDPHVFAKTEHNLTILADLGLPVPSVLASDLTKTNYPFAYLILPEIPGRDLRYELNAMTPDQMTRLAAQIVAFQRKVETLPQGTGYGYVAIGEPGPCASWWEVIRPSEGIENQFESKAKGKQGPREADVVARWEARVLKEVAGFEPYFLQIPPICFLDDTTVKNVIVQQGELQGLVDFDCVCYGDPLYWMALTAAGVVSDVGIRELFYVEELKRFWGLNEQQQQVLALYSAWIALWFVRRFATEETPDWKERMLTAIESWMEVF